MAQFKIQIPTDIVRSKEYSSNEFVLLAKLIQAYYSQPGDYKSLTFRISHKTFMNYLMINDNKTFKKCLDGLIEKEVIKNQIEKLPRKGGIEITLDEKVIPELNKIGFFTQLPYIVLNREVIESVGYTGIRLLYYYQSFINVRDYDKQYSHVTEEQAEEQLGITKKTVIKYNGLLEKRKFIKITKHKSQNDENNKFLFIKYNNQYFLQMDKVNAFCEKRRSLVL